MATGPPPIKQGIILERGPSLADGSHSTVKARQVASRYRSAMSIAKEIIMKIFGKMGEEERDNC